MAPSGYDSFRSFQAKRTRAQRRPRRRAALCRLHLEGLETRDLPSGTPAAADQLRQAYGQVPLSFEANQGQADASVKYLAHGQGYSLFLTAADAVLNLSHPADASRDGAMTGSTLDIRLIGANAAPQVAGVDPLAGVSNYFIGNNLRGWHSNIPTYGQVAYHNVYPGIDVVYYGNQQQLEYDFNLAPGADARLIHLDFGGAQGLSLDDAGNLVVQLAGGTVVEHAPVLYQWGPHGKEPVAGHYVLEGNHQAGFAVGAYDPSRELIIDPTLSYSTYIGGTFFDAGQGIAIDGAGNAYITGYTYSSDFPTTTGAVQSGLNGGRSAFIAKLNAAGTALVYSTYVGGSAIDLGAGIAIDGAGNAYITGSTNSPDFPTTTGALQTTLKGSQNAFVTELNAAGTALVYSTYLGGSGSDEATAIAVTGGSAYVTGDTSSADFPATVGAFQTASQTAGQPTGFVAKVNSGGTALAYATYLGGSSVDKGEGIAVDGSGSAYVTGSTSSPDFPTTTGAYQTTLPGSQNAFVTKLSADGSALVYSTYLGGNSSDAGAGIAVDPSGNAVVVGTTGSLNFPTTAGAVQRSLKGFDNAFITKLSATGSSLGFSTYLGGSGGDHGTAVALDNLGNTYVTGYTTSPDFPTTSSASEARLQGSSNAFVAKIKAGATALVYSSYLGGTGSEQGTGIAVDGVGNIYLTGYTRSGDFPTSRGAYQTMLAGDANAFVTKLSFPTTHYQITMPASSAAGSSFSISVTALDDTNTLVRTYTGSIHFTSNDSQAILPADYTFTAADNGTHIFTVTLKSSGSRTVTATDKATAAVTGTGTLTITPLAPVGITVGGFPSPATAGAAAGFTVTARDQYGNAAVSYTGTVHLASTDPAAVLPADYTFVAADQGVHTFSVTLKTVGTRALTATDKANATFTGTQGNITVVAAAASSVTAAGFPASTTAGVPGNITLTLKDPYGNIATGYRGTVHFTSTDAQVVLPANYTFTASDNGVHTFSVTLKTAGTQSITATDTVTGSLSSTQSGIVVSPAAASSLTAAGFPGTVTAGTAGNWTVTLKDPYGNVATGYTGTVRFSSTDAQAALPTDYAFTAADRGVHTFSITLKTAGTQSLTATDRTTGSLTATQSGITVNPAAFSMFVVSGFPSPAAAGTSNSVTVKATDAYSNVTATYAGAIHFTSSDTQATLPADYTFVAADHGVHTFTGVVLKSAGTQTIKATDKANANFTGTQSVRITAAAAVTLLMPGIPSPATAGVPADATVTLKDTYGNVATGYTGSVHFTSSDTAANLPADYTFTAADAGVHTFSITMRTVGTQTLKVTDKVNASLTATQNGIVVNPGAASVFIVSGFPSPVNAGTVGSFTITVRDNSGNTATGYTGTIRFSSSDAQASLPANYTFTAADRGVHTFSNAATLETAGTQSITATDTANGSVTGAQTGIQVNPLTPVNLAVAGFPSPATAGAAGSFTVRAVDVYGNTAPAYTGAIHFTSTDTAAVLPADYTFTAADRGAHVFSATFKTAATQSLTATDKANANFKSTQSGIVVNPAAPSSLLMAGFPTTVTAGVADNMTITLKDPFGNVATNYTGTIHFSSTDPQAALPSDYTFTATDRGVHTFSITLKTAGTRSITAASTANGTLTATQSGITVNPAAPAALAVTGFPAAPTAGVAGSVTVTAQDAFGNTTPTYAGAVHFTSSDAQATLPADYTFVAADHGVHTFTNAATLRTAATQTITATDKATASIKGTQSGITVNPAATTTLVLAGLPTPRTAGVAGNVTATLKDAFGNVTPAYRGTVHVSSSDAQAVLPADYTFTAADAGVHTFSVTLKTAATQTITVTDKATGSITATQSGIVVNPAATATLVVAGFPASITAGTAGNVTVTAKDAFGNVTPAYTGAVHFTSTDAQAALPADYTFVAADRGVHTFSVTLKTTATQTITVTDKATGSITGMQSGIVVNPAAAASLLLAGLPSPVTAGVAGNVTVTLKDAFGNVATGYTGAVHFTSSDGQAALPVDYTFVAADRGVHTFSATLKTAGTQSLRVADKVNGSLAATQSGITVNAAAASSFVVAGFPASITAGVAGTFTVTAQDAFGNKAVGYRGTVHVTSSDSQAILPADYAFTAADTGVHTFNATFRTAGTQSLTVTDTANGSVKGTQSGIRVIPAASVLVVAGFPSPATAGAANTFTVTAKDNFGNIASTYAGTVHFTSTDAQAVLPANYTFTAADNGTHTFTATLKTVGTQSLTATDTQNANIKGTQSGITVNPAAAATLVVGGFPASVVAGTAGALTVTAKDAFGNVATGYTGTVHFTSNDAQAALPVDFTFAAADHGVHTFSVILKTAGTRSLTATDKAAAGITGTQSGISVSPATTAALAVAGFPSPVTAGVAGSVTVTAQDAFGNTTPTYTGAVHFTSSDAQAILPADYTFTGTDAGVHTFSGVILKTAATQTITATDKATASIKGMQSDIVVNAAAAASLVLGGLPASVVAGTASSLTVTARDTYGNTAAGYTGTVTFSSTDADATLPADYTFTAADAGVHTFAGVVLRTVGTRFVVANDTVNDQVSGITSTRVTVAAVDHFAVTAAASPAVAGTPFSVTLVAKDAFGNTVTAYRGTVHFTSTDPHPATLPANYTFTAGDNGVHTFTGGATLFTAGSQSITATDTATASVTGGVSVTVTPAATARLLVTTSAGSVVAGTPVDITVTAQDAYSNTTAGYTGTVHFSSTDPHPALLPADYTFTAADNGSHKFTGGATLFTAGSRSITATDTTTASVTGSATVTVTAAAATHLLVTTSAGTVTAGAALDVTVTAQDAYGNTAMGYTGTVHFTSTDPHPATLPADYAFTAADNGSRTFTGGATLFTAGSQSITATDTATASITGSASVTVTAGAATHFLVTTSADMVAQGVPFDVTVTAQDAYGNTATGYTGTVHFSSSDPRAMLPGDYTFTAGTGGDNGSHTFTAGATLFTAGSQSITATDTTTGSITGSASVTVAAGVDHFQVTTSVDGSSTVAGTPFDVTVIALDADGNVLTGYTGTVHFSSADPFGAVLPADYTFQPSDMGSVTFAGGVTLFTAGTRDVTVTDTTNQATGTDAVTVTPAAADHFRIDTPATTVAGQAFDVTVTALDPYGNTDVNYQGTVTFSSQDPYGAMLPADYTFQDTDMGSVTFAGGATLFTAGTWDVTATDTGSGIAGTANVDMTPAAAVQLRVTTSVVTTVAGVAFDVTVTALDLYGNIDINYLGTITFTSADPYGATLPADYTFQDTDMGSVTFAGGATLYTAGTWDVTATDTDSGITGTTDVTVTPAAADHFRIDAVATSVAGQAFDVTVTALDHFGNIDTNYQGAITFTSTDAAALLPDDYTFTADDAGVHVFAGRVTLFTAGNQDITATDTDSGITGTATVLVTPAAADHFRIIVPSQAVSGQPFDVTVVALDPYGNIDVNYQGTIHFSSSDEDPGVVLPDDYTFTADDQGMHTFAAGVTLVTLGDQTLSVMDVDSGISGDATVTVTGAGAPGAGGQGVTAARAPSTAAAPRQASEEMPASHSPAHPPAPKGVALAPDAALDYFFHRMSRRPSADWWTDEGLVS